MCVHNVMQGSVNIDKLLAYLGSYTFSFDDTGFSSSYCVVL